MQGEKIIVNVYGEKKEFFYKKNLDNRRNNRRRFLFESKDGDTYEGTLDEENNFKRGKLTQKTGDYQDGLWENGKFISGKVSITDNNDNVYKGEWKDNMRNGQGTYTCKKTGDYQDGLWENGKFISGKVGVYKGEWINCNWHGTGKLTYVDGDYKDGLWENGKFISGKGRSTYSDGVYTGDYKNGDMNGKGEYHFNNGDRYVGEFQDGWRHGEGKLIDEDNCTYYEGNFQYNQKDGKGKYFFNNGHTVDCAFVNGNFIKDYTIRERHNELCIVLVAAHDHDNEDKKRYLSLTEYNKMIKNKYNYERSDNLGFVVPHHEISGDYNKKEIDEELLTEQIGRIEWFINNRISRNNNKNYFKVLKIHIDEHGGEDQTYEKEITPFVEEVLKIAKEKGIKNILITNNSCYGATKDPVIEKKRENWHNIFPNLEYSPPTLEDVCHNVFKDKENINIFIKKNNKKTVNNVVKAVYTKDDKKCGLKLYTKDDKKCEKCGLKLFWSGQPVINKYDRNGYFTSSNKDAIHKMYSNFYGTDFRYSNIDIDEERKLRNLGTYSFKTNNLRNVSK